MKKLTLAISLLLALCLALPVVAEETTDPVLLAYYTFDDAEDIGKDASGNENDLVRFVNPDGITAVDGKVNGAVHFGGTSGLTPFDDDNNDFLDKFGKGSITVAYYAKMDVPEELTNMIGYRVVDNGINGNTDGFTTMLYIRVREDGTKALSFHGITGSSEWVGAYVDGDVADWHHYMLVYDAEACTSTIYVDGVKAGETYADDETIGNPFTFCIGGCWAQWDWFNGGNGHDVTANGFVGAIDEVKVIAGAVHDVAAVEAMK